MRIIFAGTPATAIPSLDRLARDHEIIAVLTREPAPVGRKKVLTPSPVHQHALELGLDVLTPRTLRDPEIQATLRDLAPEAIAVVAYGLIIPPEALEIPTHGWINLHYSLLPRWRGAAPVQYAVAAGDETTGTSVFRIEEGLDTGDVAAMEEHPVAGRTAGKLLDFLSDTGAEQLARVFDQLEEGTAEFTTQEGETTHAPQLTTKNSRIDWTASADLVDSAIRGYTPEPGPWTMLDGQRVKVGPVTVLDSSELSPGELAGGKRAIVGTGTNDVELGEVAPAGKKWMRAADWMRGLKVERPIFDSEDER